MQRHQGLVVARVLDAVEHVWQGRGNAVQIAVEQPALGWSGKLLRDERQGQAIDVPHEQGRAQLLRQGHEGGDVLPD